MRKDSIVEQPVVLDQILQRVAALESRVPMAAMPGRAGTAMPMLTPVHLALLALKSRRARNAYFDGAFFGEPAYDILLDLYVNDAQRRNVSVSSACLAAGVPTTTALRAVTLLTEAGLVVRRSDQRDARRHFLHLTDDGRSRVERFLTDSIARATSYRAKLGSAELPEFWQ